MPSRHIHTHQIENIIFQNQKEGYKKKENLWENTGPPDNGANPDGQDEVAPACRITPIQYQVLPCPICHRNGKHMSRSYDGYEINTCLVDPENNHSWRVDYQTIGKELFETIKADFEQAVSLVNDLQGIVGKFGYSWGKTAKGRDKQQIENVSRKLHLLRDLLENAGETLPHNRNGAEIAHQTAIVKANEFQQEINQRVFIGARFFRSAEDAQRAAAIVLEKFFIRPRMVVIPVSPILDVERVVLALPRDPRDTLEAHNIAQARAWLASISVAEYPEPLSPVVSLVLPPPPDEPELPEEPIRRRAKNEPDSFERNDYRGVAFGKDHLDALNIARVLRRDLEISVRVVTLPPSADHPQERSLILVPKDIDPIIQEMLDYWLRNMDPLPSGFAHRLKDRTEPEQFSIRNNGQVYIGLAFASCYAEARAKAMRLKREFGLSVRCKPAPPSPEQPERHLIMVPEGVDPETARIYRIWLGETEAPFIPGNPQT